MIEIFRLDVDCWLTFPMDSRDEFILLNIDEVVDPPTPPCEPRLLLQYSPQYASTAENV